MKKVFFISLILACLFLSACGDQYDDQGNGNPTDTTKSTLNVQLAEDTPHEIQNVQGEKITIMKLDMWTSAGEAKIYSIPIYFSYEKDFGIFAGACNIQDENGQRLDLWQKVDFPSTTSYYWQFFFVPDESGQPDNYAPTVVGTMQKTFFLACYFSTEMGTDEQTLEARILDVKSDYDLSIKSRIGVLRTTVRIYE